MRKSYLNSGGTYLNVNSNALHSTMRARAIIIALVAAVLFENTKSASDEDIQVRRAV